MYRFPLVLGWDVSGVVEAVGTGKKNYRAGDSVYAYVDLGRGGGYAEYIVAKEREISLKPKSLSHTEAAALPLAALTAWQALFDYAQLSAGQTVLIHGAAGGVGTFAVQLARWKGARVIGTASARNHEFLRKLGADQVIDYNTTKFEEVVKDVDVVFDMIGGDTQERSWAVLKKGGMLVSIVQPPSAQRAAEFGVRRADLLVEPNAAQLAQLTALIEAGRLKPVVQTVLPLTEVRKAHEMSESGHTRGKIVLQVRQ